MTKGSEQKETEISFNNAEKENRRMRAVIDLLGGASVADVSQQFGICRSDLFKLQHCSLINLTFTQ